MIQISSHHMKAANSSHSRRPTATNPPRSITLIASSCRTPANLGCFGWRLRMTKHGMTAEQSHYAGQPIGAQERHDYQPINIDYTFSDFRRTRDQNRQILQEFGKLAGMTPP